MPQVITEQKCSDFFAFMREREAIRLRRAAGMPPPWTEDPILQKFSFTNVKREHDRTSRLLRTEFYEPNSGARNALLLLNCAVARYFGTIETIRTLGWQNNWYPERMRRLLKEKEKNGSKVFTGAYVITNAGIPGSKIDVVIDYFLAALWEQRKDVLFAISTGSWQSASERLQQIFGFGGTGFMTKEVLLDTFYTDLWAPGTPTDRNTWTPVGPGSMRGAADLAGREKALNKAETLEVCRYVFSQRAHHWSGVELELTDIQFQLCEWFKYRKVQLGLGRPRSLFKPREQ